MAETSPSGERGASARAGVRLDARAGVLFGALGFEEEALRAELRTGVLRAGVFAGVFSCAAAAAAAAFSAAPSPPRLFPAPPPP